MYRILTHSYVTREGNDQRFYANNYLELRHELNLKIDTRADLFQTLYFAEDDVELRFHDNEVVIYNKVFNTTPIAVHSNGYAKLFIRTFANYISKTWNPVDGCLECREDTKDLSQLEVIYRSTSVSLNFELYIFITDRTISQRRDRTFYNEKVFTRRIF